MSEDSFQRFVVDQLTRLGVVTARAMFGGYGLYHRDFFFGIIHGGRLYLKTDEQSRAGYLDRGMQPFRPNHRQTLRAYYQVPADVLEDDEALVEWARTSLRAGGG